MKVIKVAELFAGVGGFRIGLEQASDRFKIVWSNQWEPSTKKQYASEVYAARFGHQGHCNLDIATVPVSDIPDVDLLVGGFPCQDYSVARTLKMSAGLEGKKGVLWWQIHRILKEKAHKPAFLLLENVDRLLKSPVKQRGRDLAIMLASLSDLGYIVEWRVINAAEYGMPQRRRRVFILGYHQSTALHKRISKLKDPTDWIADKGILSQSFPVQPSAVPASFDIEGDLADISTRFNKTHADSSPFENTGIIIDRKVYTMATQPAYDGPYATLGDVLLPDAKVPPQYFIEPKQIDQWIYLKGSKQEKRVNQSTGFTYHYAEGSMVFPDATDRPSRTIVTGEGGSSASRFKHVVKTKDGRLRRLTPIELERLNMFPDDHTAGASDVKRAFFMGNALVVGIVERIGRTLVGAL